MNDDFDAFFASTYSRTMAKALLLDGHRQDDEDAVAEAYAIVAARWDVARTYDAPEAYLYVTMQRLVWRAIRRRRQRAEEPIPEHLELPALADTSLAEVFEALAELTPAQRAVVVLCCVEGHEQRAVAKMLGIARGTVAAHLSAARRRLSDVFARAGFHEFEPVGLPDLLREADSTLATALSADRSARARLDAKIAVGVPAEPGWWQRLWGRR